MSLPSADQTPTLATERGDVRPTGALDAEIGGHWGRYVVLEHIGSGGMGHVVRAYDPKLQREVAIKRLRHDACVDGGTDRLVREAQAMAQLNSPHVVAIYDVEVSDDGVLLVMELVVGTTLRRWLKAETRPLPVVLDAFRRAGEGLYAAHLAGLVHRDFKPSNVLVANDGAIKVTDFGLARATSDISASPSRLRASDDLVAMPPHIRSSDSVDLSAPLTRADQVVGTPRYMAPEQYEGHTADARADQYALCVAVWEAIVGHPPVETEDYVQQHERKLEGPPPWPRDVSAPRDLVAALRRGLAVEPEDRWPSLRPVLDALRDPRPRRRRIAVFASLGLVVVATAGTVALTRERPCTGAADQLAGSWDDARREAVDQALRATGLSYAADSAARVATAIDDFGARWVEQHTEACRATAIRGEQSDAVLDLRMACLQRQLGRLDATVELLSDPDDAIAERSVDLAAGLPDPARCADIEALRADVPPPEDPGAAAEVDEIRRVLARISVQRQAGRLEDVRRTLAELGPRIEAVAHPPLTARYHLDQARLASDSGDDATAVDGFRVALREALAAGDDAGAAWAAVSATRSLADLSRFDEGEWMAQLAVGLSRGEPAARAAEPHALMSLAWLRQAQGRYEEEEARVREAIAILEARDRDSDPNLVTMLGTLANALAMQGRFSESERIHRRAVALAESVHGSEHPTVALAYNNLAGALYRHGEIDEAVARTRDALDLYERVYGPDHPTTARTRGNLGLLLDALGQYPAAEAELRKARDALRRVGTAEPHTLALLDVNLGITLSEQGRHEEAITAYDRGIATLTKVLGPDHPDVARARHNLAKSLSDAEDYERAEREYRRILANPGGLPDDHPPLVRARSGLGAILCNEASARCDEGLPLLREAWTIVDTDEWDPTQRGLTAFALAQALWTRDIDRERAKELARQAAELFSRGPTGARSREAVRKWLDTHQ